MNTRMMIGITVMLAALFVMAENLVYASRFGPAAWPVLQWTLPGVVVVGLAGVVIYEVGERAWRRDE